ncbi:hypothetical protein [Cryobacterium tagatosivorans]|uniref:Uncharacterized protein n=1 Tax=Cryobacterium tagatosivorans TaxID=1259199 RepID=A0A4R8UGP3_9MICO|nr:hypothetical protein [Cryobacterium tagatosivorans]TFB52813.1 hypothetical protein E3O23_05805 [Cryobacterium tagatosivorans]
MRHLGLRHRLARAALGRDTSSFARRWPGKVLIAVILPAIPAAMLFKSVSGGTYADDSWAALLMAAALALAYLVSRRLLVTVLVAGLVVGVTSWVLAPDLATTDLLGVDLLGADLRGPD